VEGRHIEIGDQDGVGLVARRLTTANWPSRTTGRTTLAEALAALEEGIRAWCEERGIELD
jgi:hypothetical protein